MNANDLHQLPESHPIAQRPRVSLGHIDTAAIWHRSLDRIAANAANHDAKNLQAGVLFSVGQSVKTLRGDTGVVVGLNGGNISVDVANRVRVFTASSLRFA